jgi:hypothetical protein
MKRSAIWGNLPDGQLSPRLKAAWARARCYSNTTTFATMIYLIAAPLGDLFQST